MALSMCHRRLLVANGYGCGYGNGISICNSRIASTTRSFSFGNLRTTLPRICRRFSAQNSFTQPDYTHKLILEVKEKLETEHQDLPLGKNGRDDEDMILWFLRDRKFSVEDAVSKLTKAIKWRQEFGVSDLTEGAVESVAKTGKAYVHDFLDVKERPVLAVVASKHIPNAYDPVEDMKLCAFLIEKALNKLSPGKEQILGIFDLRGFRTENADMKNKTVKKTLQLGTLGHGALPVLKKALQHGNTNEYLGWHYSPFSGGNNEKFDVFYCYYPKRLSEVLFVDAPFVFKPIWQMVKPLVKSYASLVRFCSAETVWQEYFTDETVPASFRD